jgi:uracil-DNA glycosylase family 4
MATDKPDSFPALHTQRDQAMLTRKARWNRYVARWSSCQKCPLGGLAVHHVTGSNLTGDDRPDVLFIGEAPGFTEDILAQPFVGRVGRKLRQWWREAGGDRLLTVYNNVLLCKPQARRRGQIREPSFEEQMACQPHLREVLAILEPRAIVLLGSVALATAGPIAVEHGYSGSGRGLILRSLPHPSWVIRSMDPEEEVRYRKRLTDLVRILEEHK